MSSVQDCDYLFKLVMVGATGVGKSALLLRLVDNYFSSELLTTLGVEFKTYVTEADGKNVRLHIWDTAGQERFYSIASTYYRGAHGVIIVFDVTNKESFDKVRAWLNDIEEKAPADAQAAFKLLIANKCDMIHERIVSPAMGRMLADELRMEYMETSAKTAMNVREAFNAMAIGLKRRSAREPLPASGSAPLRVLVSGDSVGGYFGSCSC